MYGIDSGITHYYAALLNVYIQEISVSAIENRRGGNAIQCEGLRNAIDPVYCLNVIITINLDLIDNVIRTIVIIVKSQIYSNKDIFRVSHFTFYRGSYFT